MSKKQKLLIVCGPTATGKTQLGLKLAQQFNGEIISADSRQVYQQMDIGTGKDLPPNSLQHPSGYYLINGIKLWGYDLVKPDQEFSLAHFVNFAQKIINQIWSQKQLPIVVGGTGLYLKAISQPIETINIPPDQKLRQELAKKTVQSLQDILKKLNPSRFKSMNHSDQHNPRRLIRAIEIERSGLTKTPASFQSQNSLWVGLTAPRKILEQRIDERVEKRLRLGLQKEIETLIKQGYGWDLPAMSAMGYKQWQPFFNQQATLRQVIEAWKLAEKQYLRRQLTWFKKNPQINWFDITQSHYQSRVVKLVRSWYTQK
jgi:tRNA dimethylallyltransferase